MFRFITEAMPAFLAGAVATQNPFHIAMCAGGLVSLAIKIGSGAAQWVPGRGEIATMLAATLIGKFVPLTGEFNHMHLLSATALIGSGINAAGRVWQHYFG